MSVKSLFKIPKCRIKVQCLLCANGSNKTIKKYISPNTGKVKPNCNVQAYTEQVIN